jgi:3-deoxy-D-arabino-heptulosonate 7-phosphate (DAHP) synthase
VIVQMQTGLGPEHEWTRAVTRAAEERGLRPVVQENVGEAHRVTEVHLRNGEVEAASIPEHVFNQMAGVNMVRRVTPSKVSLASDAGHHRVRLGKTEVGYGLPCLLIAGPCTVDRHIDSLVGRLVEEFGIRHIRGGCWKPRSSAYSFPGHGEKAVDWLLQAAQAHGVETVLTEVIDTSHVEAVRRARDRSGYRGQIVLWIGARTYNLTLLQELGRQREFPVILKNPIDARSVGEWVARAEYILAGEREYDEDGHLIPDRSLSQGNDQILLCSRGVTQTDPESRYRFDPRHSWIDTVHQRYWCPVGVDPSHSAGTMRDDLVLRNLQAALLEGPDFVLLEVYDMEDGRKPLCDAEQAVPLTRLREVQELLRSYNRRFG